MQTIRSRKSKSHPRAGSAMPRLLIAGFGYVGQAAAKVFREAGWDIEGWTLSAESAQKFAGLPFPIRAVDIGNAHSSAVTLPGQFDWIIHCASSRGGDAGIIVTSIWTAPETFSAVF